MEPLVSQNQEMGIIIPALKSCLYMLGCMGILIIAYYCIYVIHHVAYWIAQKAVKMVYDHVDGLQPSPHDITTVQDRMNAYFKVCTYICIYIIVWLAVELVVQVMQIGNL